MLTKILIYRYTVANGLTCVETIEETPERAKRWAVEALQHYANARAATCGQTAQPVFPGWARVGNFLCVTTDDYFAICYQPK